MELFHEDVEGPGFATLIDLSNATAVFPRRPAFVVEVTLPPVIVDATLLADEETSCVVGLSVSLEVDGCAELVVA